MHVEMSALAALTTEKDIPLEELIYAIEVAVLGAYNQTDTAKRHARAHLDRETGEIQILVPIFGEDGTRISEEVDSPDGFSRVATSTARQIIKLKMRETNDAEIVGEFTASVGDVISGVVQQGRDPKMINVNLGRVLEGDEVRVLENRKVGGNRGVHALDDHFVQRADRARDRGVAVLAPDDQFADEVVVILTDSVA